MNKKKRKRRTFYEPESEKVVSWLNNQTDLGTSLQLIIVDAIRRYGEGDVIKAHLNQREYDTTNASIPQSPPSLDPPLVHEKVVDDKGEIEDPKEDPKFLEKEYASEPQQPQGGDADETIQDVEPDDDMELDTADIMADAVGSIEEEDEPEYDPVEILMRDSGSTFSK